MNDKVVSLTDKINEQTLANEKKLNYDFLTSIQEVMFDHILNNRCIGEFDQDTLEEINARISTLCLIAMNITKTIQQTLKLSYKSL
tara:strand:- start:480 stop:737 length:258 start_codon:yes stop_codon:yes gene_type:complete